VIDEAWCIGCTLCIKACPVDCIVGAPSRCTPSSSPVHRLRTVPAGLPGGLHRHGARHRAAHRLAGLERAAGRPGARALRFHRLPSQREARERRASGRQGRGQAGRPAAASQLTDPEALERKRAIIEAACSGRATGPRASHDRRRPIERLLRHAGVRPTRSPQTELSYSSVFELLAAVLLSAQATDVSVNKATAGCSPGRHAAGHALTLGEEGIAEHIKTIGLFRNKAKNTLALSRLLLERHGGEVPAEREALEALPGVGRKTANVVLNTAFRQPTMAVDTHIFRVANRTGLAPGKDVLEVEKALLRACPRTTCSTPTTG
jgi:endonuclease-3